MGLTDRLSRAIALGETPLSASEVRAEARRLLAAESPWRLAEEVEPVVGAVMGLGPIQALFDDPDVTDILVNGPFEVWQDRGNGLEMADVAFDSDDHLVATVERAIAPLGLRIDRLAPMVDARLPDGSRLHAVLPPAAVDHPLVAVRRFSQQIASLDDLAAVGWATEQQLEELRHAVRAAKTIVVSGGTGTGKTTLLNLLGALIPANERVVTIEDAAELSLPGHVVRLEARPPELRGCGGDKHPRAGPLRVEAAAGPSHRRGGAGTRSARPRLRPEHGPPRIHDDRPRQQSGGGDMAAGDAGPVGG